MDGFFIDYKGWQIPNLPGVLNRVEDFEKNFKSREDDIWICGYAKCGTHWVSEIIRILLTGSFENREPKEKFFVEMTSHRQWTNLESPRTLNTHLPPSLLPESIVFDSKIIFLIRNVRDVFVSLYGHYRCRVKEEDAASWDTFFDTVIQDVEIFRYQNDWIKISQRRQPGTFLVLKYEDLKENPIGGIEHIAKFVKVKREREFVERVAMATSFEAMKSAYKGVSVSVDDTGKELAVGTLYRKGIVGDWKNWFTEEQTRRFDEWYKEEIGDLSFGNEAYMNV